jgi:hypothetical protein
MTGPAGTFVGLLGERALRPVNPAIRTEVRPVQVVRTTGESLPFEPFLAMIRDAIAVAIGQLPDTRRRRHIERTVVPHRALGKHHPVGEHDRGVEAAVAVRVLETHYPVRPVGKLLLDLVIRSR